jgi:hypothetical protein
MGWKNLGEKPVIGTPWFRLNMADVELPGGRRLIAGGRIRSAVTAAALMLLRDCRTGET